VLGDSLVRSAQPQMSARRAKPRKSNYCDSVEACSIGIHSCQREIDRFASTADDSTADDSTADFSGRCSFAVGRGHHLRFGFAIGRPNGIASRPIECRTPRRVSTSDTKRRDTKCSRRPDAALVLASRAPLLAAQKATEHSRMLRVRIIFFEAIHFRFDASGRLSTAMIDANQQLIGSNGIMSMGDLDRASDCADVSARCDVSTPHSSLRPWDDRRLERQRATRSGAPSGSRLAERAA
jgi:hypothetical protein